MIEIVRIPGTQRYGAEQIGAKAAGLLEMAGLGLPVPPAFVLPIRSCAELSKPETANDLAEALSEGIRFLEESTGKKFGDRRRPLLVAVRSGAARSMPGMMDTVLNAGCTIAATHGLIRASGNPRFAWDSRRRFLEEFAATVLGVDRANFIAKLHELIQGEGATNDRELDCEALQRLAASYEQLIADEGRRVDDDAMAQLSMAVRCVCRSWSADRARKYRSLERLDDLPGTAVTIQAMVFGNRGLTSGAGVAFSRNPSTGEPEPMIDVLIDAQGEDVVSGRRVPETEATIAGKLPEVLAELREVLRRLESHYRDAQDVEFTVEDGRLWILQTRPAKRTPRAALKIAIDLVREGVLSEAEAVRRLGGIDIAQLAVTRLANPGEPAARGVGASGGVAVGRAAFDPAAAERLAALGDPVILLRSEMSTEDVTGIALAAAIVTTAGGRTAHAALVARQKGKPCVVGCAGLSVDASARQGALAGHTILEGDWVSVDGEGGGIFFGRRDIVIEKPERELAELAGFRHSGSSTEILYA